MKTLRIITIATVVIALLIMAVNIFLLENNPFLNIFYIFIIVYSIIYLILYKKYPNNSQLPLFMILLVITAVVSLLYTSLSTESFEAMASIAGVSAFLFVIVEKLIKVAEQIK